MENFVIREGDNLSKYQKKENEILRYIEDNCENENWINLK